VFFHGYSYFLNFFSLQLLLFEAERGWAYAQELINASFQPANKEEAGKLRHRATGRFRRAVNWSTRLLSVCQTLHTSSRMSTENLIEANVYTLILNSRFLRYRDDFEDALIQLSVARGLLDNLASTASTSRDQALSVLFSDEIAPEIRYCAHELGHERAYNINGIVAELSPKYRNQIVENCDNLVSKLQKDQAANSKTNSTLRERLWDSQPVPMRYPELVDVFLKVEAAEVVLDKSGAKKTKTGVTAYDAVLSALSDAEGVARRLQESQQVCSDPPSSFFVSHRISLQAPQQPLEVRSATSTSCMHTPYTSSSLGAFSEIYFS
jgi:signal recognition particle subunit SRP68